MNIIYNESKYILKIEKDDASIGDIQENILKTCSLMIYNIENTELILKNGKTFILGSNDCIFKEILSNFIKNNVDDIILSNDYLAQIDKFIVYDRKRDENGNVIKNNVIIDNYNTWFNENENQKYLNYSSSSYMHRYNNDNNIISLFSNIFNNELSNRNINLDDNQYISHIFRHYINTQSNTNVNTTTQENENTIQTDNNVQTDNTIQQDNNITINNEEFSNMVNIFDTYINNSEREQRTNNIRNNILYNHFSNIYSNLNSNENNTSTNDTNEEPENNEEEMKSNEEPSNETPETNSDDIQYVNQFITENNINSFIENSPIFNMFRNISANIEIDEPEIINSNDEYLTFNIPISIYNQHNFEDVIVSLTEEQFNELTCYECTGENTEKDCNICIECFNKDDSIVKLNCNHEFHKDCIKKWLCNNSTKCPVCRVEVAKGKANL